MTVYNLPKQIRAIIFDIDSTLYTCQAYAFEQIDCQVREYAKLRGITADEARKLVAEYRKKYAAEHDGKKISLGNTLVSFGIPIEQSVAWRNQLMEPERFLHYDEKLVAALEELQKKVKMICVTNNPVLPARKTLEVIGVSAFFPKIVGLDTCYKSKPAIEPFQTALEWLNVDANECIAVGDRYDLDIALPLEMGMGGVLVSGVEEVYQIHKNVL